jgi:hypothetical protein
VTLASAGEAELERSGVAQERLRFVFFAFLWCGERSGKVIK